TDVPQDDLGGRHLDEEERPTMVEPTRPTRVTLEMLILPHFDYAVPLLRSPQTELHYVPFYAVCHMLELTSTEEIERARHTGVWSSACLLVLPRGASRVSAAHPGVVAWCIPYPLPAGYWMANVRRRVRDPERRAQLKRAVADAMELAAGAFDLMLARYQAGR